MIGQAEHWLKLGGGRSAQEAAPEAITLGQDMCIRRRRYV